jgi:Cft2 family RNA processing exonuclease
LAPLMLKNSASVMTRQKEEKDVPEYPLFGKEDITALQKKFFVLKTGKTYCLEKDGQTAKVTIYAAGHVLGAVSVLIEYEGRRLFITGDILFSD